MVERLSVFAVLISALLNCCLWFSCLDRLSTETNAPLLPEEAEKASEYEAESEQETVRLAELHHVFAEVALHFGEGFRQVSAASHLLSGHCCVTDFARGPPCC